MCINTYSPIERVCVECPSYILGAPAPSQLEPTMWLEVVYYSGVVLSFIKVYYEAIRKSRGKEKTYI